MDVFKKKIEEYEENMKDMVKYYSGGNQYQININPESKIFEDKVIYTLKQENQILKRKLYNKIAQIHPSYENNNNYLSHLNIDNLLDLKSRVIETQLEVEDILLWNAINDGYEKLPQQYKISMQDIKDLLVYMQESVLNHPSLMTNSGKKSSPSLRSYRSQKSHRSHLQVNRIGE